MIKFISFYCLLLFFSYEIMANDLDIKNYRNKAQLIIIDRAAAGGRKIEVNNAEVILYKNIEITLYNCWKSPTNKNESAALVKIEQIIPSEKYQKELALQKQLSSRARKRINNDIKENDFENFTTKKIFSGWLLSKYRYVATVEHPIYDFWLDKCL